VTIDAPRRSLDRYAVQIDGATWTMDVKARTVPTPPRPAVRRGPDPGADRTEHRPHRRDPRCRSDTDHPHRLRQHRDGSDRERCGTNEFDDHVAGEISGGPAEIKVLSNGDLVTVADGWFEVFRSAPNPVAVCEVLNEMLGVARPAISAAHDGSNVTVFVGFADSATAVERVSARGAMALLDVVADIGVGRIGLCAAAHCVDVYIDRSPR
jgi:hypothetical protein